MTFLTLLKRAFFDSHLGSHSPSRKVLLMLRKKKKKKKRKGEEMSLHTHIIKTMNYGLFLQPYSFKNIIQL